MTRRPGLLQAAMACVLALTLVMAPDLAGQGLDPGLEAVPGHPPPSGPAGPVLDQPLIQTEGRYAVVHLKQNRVFVFEGRTGVWSAPAGTGTGFRLAGEGQRWTFTTPRGLFRVIRKEKDPVWEAPDWYFVERGRPLPPDGDARRRIPGVMGNTAVYLGDGIAIHGTNDPERLLNPDPDRRRISHGCIRLTNESAREFFHLVPVGTPVLIY